MPNKLVIVESPAKAKTIAKYLGAGYVVEASIGHIRDLPRGAKDVPEEMKSKPWASLGVDTENEFKPLYVVPSEKQAQIKKLKALLKTADELFLATDEDREGESISWHLKEVLNPKVPIRRMVFHEITKAAIQNAVANPREINFALVDAQETRRVLDRLYGYEISPVLWRKVMPRLSAGRVQSVATRMIVERERERMRFKSGTYWDLTAELDKKGQTFSATLNSVNGKRIAAGRDFDPATGALKNDEAVLINEQQATDLAAGLEGAVFKVDSVTEKPETRRPAAPFITSTLQQEGARKLGMSADQVMRTAQRLYEQGYITYMRTDSTTLSDSAIASARAQASSLYGPEYVPASPRSYARKVKNAQEAHEAIRPAGDVFRMPNEISGEITGSELRLYELIWKRTIASQMTDAKVLVVSVRINANTNDGTKTVFAASGSTITFPGFFRAYVEGSDDPDEALADREKFLPPLSQGDVVDCQSLGTNSHSTSPPARYTEASLVKRLEEAGIGRPSTYAAILSRIQDAGYVFKKSAALVPTWTAFAVTNLLEQHFSRMVDYDFTARLEDDLDEIANHSKNRSEWLHSFYFGNGTPGLKSLVGSDGLEAIDARAISSTVIGKDDSGEDIVVRVGKYGPYVQRGDDKASLREDVAPDELTVETALQLLSAPKNDAPIGADPQSGLPVYVKVGRFGPYVQLGDAETVPAGIKPKMTSLFSTMSPDQIDLDTAMKLLNLPREVGVDSATNEVITAQNGKFGPYLKKGTDSRSLSSEDQIFTISLDEALAIYSAPKTYGRARAAAKPPLADFGVDPTNSKPVVVKDGRFGAYITDGETNVTVPRGILIEELTAERAFEMLADKRAAGPSPRAKKSAKRGAKKAAPKTTTKTVKGAASKKAASKKAATAKSATAKKASAKKSPAKSVSKKSSSSDNESPLRVVDTTDE